MKYEVPDSVIEETTKCPQDFKCLSTGICGDCEVTSVDGKNILFLESNKTKQCPYNLSFGDGTVCTCPTNYALTSIFGKKTL